jgi:hypothetical protein
MTIYKKLIIDENWETSKMRKITEHTHNKIDSAIFHLKIQWERGAVQKL